VSERTTTQTYDALARPIQSDIVQRLTSGTGSYRLRTKYDSYYGRPVGQEFPNGEAVQALYGNYGHGLAEKDPVTGIEYRRTNSVNARNQPTQETFGNGVVLNPQYQWQTGQLTELRYSSASGPLRQLNYGYDVFGNLKQQKLNTNQSQEDYSYDELHRLVQSIRSGAASGTVNYGFDAVGNFTKKTDFSTSAANAYSYTGGTCGGGANAVKSISLAAGGSRTYCYDANGNLTSDNAGLSLNYDHMGMTTVAQRGALRDDFCYGADGQRTRSWGSDGSRIYLPGYEHRLDTNETKVYLGDYAVITNDSAGRKVEYLLKDRLGSVDAVASSAGAITETRGYDAFGKPRSGTWADLTPPKLGSTNVTPKGFTQHEHLNQLELIHMNGRVFDYNVGRFTGVDPFIQFPLNSQSLNPYSYILNNPLSGTDPSGYASCSTNDTVKKCASAAGEGGTASVYKQDAGSHIKTKAGEFKNNGDGTAAVTARSGQSGTVRFAMNGGSTSQGTMGSSGRKEQAAQGSEKLAPTAQQSVTGSQTTGSTSTAPATTQTNPPAYQDVDVTAAMYPNGAPGAGRIFARIGKKSPKDFEVDVRTALTELATDPTGTLPFDQVSNAGKDIFIRYGKEHKALSSTTGDNVIDFNPRLGLFMRIRGPNNDLRQSPMMGLLHEVGHIARGLNRTAGMIVFAGGKAEWSPSEEQTVTTTYEQPAARAFRESVRVNYTDPWRNKKVQCVTCVR